MKARDKADDILLQKWLKGLYQRNVDNRGMLPDVDPSAWMPWSELLRHLYATPTAFLLQ